MAKQTIKRYSKDFGKKEKVLNYATQTYQLSRPNKVGTVMALIRECQPKTFEEWENWYFENAITDGKSPTKITKESLIELGERLYIKCFCLHLQAKNKWIGKIAMQLTLLAALQLRQSETINRNILKRKNKWQFRKHTK